MPARLVQPRPRSHRWAEVALWVTTAVSRLLGTYAVLQGVTVAWFGPDRWRASPALSKALEMPGQTLTWGLALAVAGLLVLWGSHTRRMTVTTVGHFACAVWSAFFAVAQLDTAVENPHAPTSGVAVYACLAVLFAVLAGGAWRLRQ